MKLIALAVLLALSSEAAAEPQPPGKRRHPTGYEVPGCINYILEQLPNGTWRTIPRCDRDEGKVAVTDLVDPVSRFGPHGGGGASGE